jgi:hypothetical protein
VILALLAALALTPAVEAQLKERQPPGGAPSFEALAQQGDLWVLCVRRAGEKFVEVQVAAIKDGQLKGDPATVGNSQKREDCGAAKIGAFFDFKRGKKKQKAAVVTFGGLTLTAVVTSSAEVPVWSEAAAPGGAVAIFPEARKGDTTFCAFLDQNGTKAWSRIGWVEEAGDYEPIDGKCGPK